MSPARRTTPTSSNSAESLSPVKLWLKSASLAGGSFLSHNFVKLLLKNYDLKIDGFGGHMSNFRPCNSLMLFFLPWSRPDRRCQLQGFFPSIGVNLRVACSSKKAPKELKFSGATCLVFLIVHLLHNLCLHLSFCALLLLLQSYI